MEEQNKINESAVPQQGPEQEEPSPKGGGKNMIALLSYLGILVIVPLLTAKNDPFVKYHVKQGLTLLIAWIAISFVAWIPILGWLVGALGWLVCIVLTIIGIINVIQGKEKQLPLIGQFAERFKI